MKTPQRDDRRPLPLGVPLGALDDVARLQDRLLHLEDLLALVPRLLGVELDAERGREHRGGEVFGVVARLLRRLAVAVVLGEVAVALAVGRAREADGRRDEAVRLVRVLPGHDAVDDLPRHDELLAFLAAHLLAVRREDRAHRDEVRLLDAGVAERELERREAVLVNADAVREEDRLRHEHLVHHGIAALTDRDDRRPSRLLGHRLLSGRGAGGTEASLRETATRAPE